MTRNGIKRIFVALAALTGLFGLGSARAAVYTAVWDPAYGGDFPNLGWKGQSSLLVSAGCSSGLGSGFVDVSTNEGCTASVMSASVDLYTLPPTNPAIQTSSVVVPLDGPTHTLVFDPNSLTIQTLRFFNGVLIGLTTSESNGVGDCGVADPTCNPDNPYANPVTFFLQFQLDPLSVGGFSTFGAANTVPPYNGPVLSYTCCDGNSGTNSIKPNFSITEVPEPASLTLAALGLAALGWGCSRRRQRFQA